MDPSSAQHQEILPSYQSREAMLVCSKPNHDQRKPRPQQEQALKCPRCESTNTKFCYYNNYSLSQPRYLCKSCRRYWTKGGTLRNVPVGGGCRKNKRSSSSSKRRTPDQVNNPSASPMMSCVSNFGSYHDPIDLSLAFAMLQKQSSSSPSAEHGQLGFDHHDHDQLSFFRGPTSSSTLASTRNCMLEAQNDNFHNLFNGFVDVGDHQDKVDVAMPCNEEIINNVTALSKENGNNPNKVFRGFPWQMNGESNFNMTTTDHHMDSGRESWTGFSSSWHGLLSSPLM